jgi:hypothetical protein
MFTPTKGRDEVQDFEAWLAYGRTAGWISDPACDTHDGVPISAAEEEEFMEGDPCVHILRLYPDKETRDAVEANRL